MTAPTTPPPNTPGVNSGLAALQHDRTVLQAALDHHAATAPLLALDALGSAVDELTDSEALPAHVNADAAGLAGYTAQVGHVCEADTADLAAVVAEVRARLLRHLQGPDTRVVLAAARAARELASAARTLAAAGPRPPATAGPHG